MSKTDFKTYGTTLLRQNNSVAEIPLFLSVPVDATSEQIEAAVKAIETSALSDKWSDSNSGDPVDCEYVAYTGGDLTELEQISDENYERSVEYLTNYIFKCDFVLLAWNADHSALQLVKVADKFESGKVVSDE